MQIRARSSATRECAGVHFAALGEWVILRLAGFYEDAVVLCALSEDPFIQVQVNHDQEGGEDWRGGPSIEDVRALVARLAAEDEEAAELVNDRSFTVNTQLPTAESTLERDASEIDPQVQTPPVVPDIPPLTPTVAEHEPATPPVQEAAVVAKVETKPAAKATPKPKH